MIFVSAITCSECAPMHTACLARLSGKSVRSALHSRRRRQVQPWQTVAMTVWTEPTGDVFVLGAGFSRALSCRLPLTDELGNACLDRADLRHDTRVPAAGFNGGSFESWLSGMA